MSAKLRAAYERAKENVAREAKEGRSELKLALVVERRNTLLDALLMVSE